MNPLMKKSIIAYLMLSTSLMGVTFADTPQVMPVTTSAVNAAVTTSVIDQAVPVSNQSLPAGFILNDQLVKTNKLFMPFSSTNGELYVPFKFFANTLDYKVSWDAATRAVTLELSNQTTKFRYVKDANYEYGNALIGSDGRAYSATIRMGSLYVGPQIFQESLNGVVVYDHLNQLRIDGVKYAPDEASTLGEIINIENGKDGIQILVKGQKYGSFGLDDISLAVTRLVPVTMSNGNKLSVSDLKVGDRIYVKYGKAVTRSLPAMGQAESVTLLKDESLFEGKVYWKQTSEEKNGKTDGFAPTLRQLRVVGTNDFVITVNEKTVISDANGVIKTFDDLKEGMILKVVTAPYAAMSYPAQTGAYRIEIVR